MKITFTIKTNNDAFTNDPQAEIDRIIRKWLDDNMRFKTLYDYNGNMVGTVSVTGVKAERVNQ